MKLPRPSRAAAPPLSAFLSAALYYTPLRIEEISVMIAVGFKSTREGGTEEKIQFPRKRVRLLRTRLRDSNTRPGRLLARGLAGLG
jgi:hypothetical protein